MKEFILGYIKYNTIDGKSNIDINILGLIEKIGIKIMIRKGELSTEKGIQEIELNYIYKLINILEKRNYIKLKAWEIKAIMKDLNMKSYCCSVFFKGNLSNRINFDYHNVYKISNKTEKILKKKELELDKGLININIDIQSIIKKYIGNLIPLLIESNEII